MVWRFMPLADPSVNRFIVRDLDSLLNQVRPGQAETAHVVRKRHVSRQEEGVGNFAGPLAVRESSNTRPEH